jgi:hypothetical protein
VKGIQAAFVGRLGATAGLRYTTQSWADRPGALEREIEISPIGESLPPQRQTIPGLLC